MHPDDVAAVLNAHPFIPFDVELPSNSSFRVTDAKAAALSATREALVITEPSGARHVLALKHILRISTDPLPGRGLK
ncbi:MAG TPA: hypothetical protein VKD71_02025 [Gemmataceae bacterium]|nr:hypothetical protein [Gemmataceae bacterium]